MSLRTAGIVLLKELRDSLRDRRTLFNTLVLGPLLGPLLFMALLSFAVTHEVNQAQQPLTVVVIGAERAANLVGALEQGGVVVQPAVERVELAVREQRVDLALRIPGDYTERWRHAEPAQVEIIYDSSRREMSAKAQRLQGLIDNYSLRTSTQRLMMRGLPPTLLRPVVVAERDQATPQSRAALLFGILPYLLLISVLVGGMSVAIDATAGERERASLEPLLANPVPRWQVLLGKVGAAGCFSLTTAMLSLIVLGVAGRWMPENELGMNLHLDMHFGLLAIPVLLPLVALFAVLETLVAAHARSFREAQTWLGLLQLIPIIPSVLLGFLPFNPPAWIYAVPLASQQFALLRLLRGEFVSATQIVLGVLSTLLLTWLAFRVARRRYESERLAIST